MCGQDSREIQIRLVRQVARPGFDIHLLFVKKRQRRCMNGWIQRHVLILGMLVNLIYDKPCPSSRDDRHTRSIISQTQPNFLGGETERKSKAGKREKRCQFVFWD